jgi:hypothetical protein
MTDSTTDIKKEYSCSINLFSHNQSKRVGVAKAKPNNQPCWHKRFFIFTFISTPPLGGVFVWGRGQQGHTIQTSPASREKVASRNTTNLMRIGLQKTNKAIKSTIP